MQDIKLTFNDVIIYFAVANFVLGLLFGSFPLIAGIKMKNRNYAVYGFIGSIIGGAILGVVLSYPIAMIFTWLILRKQQETVAVTDENPIETEIENSEDR